MSTRRSRDLGRREGHAATQEPRSFHRQRDRVGGDRQERQILFVEAPPSGGRMLGIGQLHRADHPQQASGKVEGDANLVLGDLLQGLVDLGAPFPRTPEATLQEGLVLPIDPRDDPTGERLSGLHLESATRPGGVEHRHQLIRGGVLGPNRDLVGVNQGHEPPEQRTHRPVAEVIQVVDGKASEFVRERMGFGLRGHGRRMSGYRRTETTDMQSRGSATGANRCLPKS